MRPSVKNISFLDDCVSADITKQFLKLVPTGVDFNSEDTEVIYTHFHKINYVSYQNLKVVVCPCRGISHILDGKPDGVEVIYLEKSDELELFNKAVSLAEWTVSSLLKLLINDNENLLGKKVGFIGFNRVAQQVAYRLSNFDVSMSYFSPETPNVEMFISNNSIKQLSSVKLICNTSDIIIMGLDDKETYSNFISEPAFAEMKDVYFINPFRAKHVCGEDLRAAFDCDNVKGFAIDDLDGYGMETVSDLIVLGTIPHTNCFVTTHKAGKGYISRLNTDIMVLNKLEKLLTGK